MGQIMGESRGARLMWHANGSKSIETKHGQQVAFKLSDGHDWHRTSVSGDNRRMPGWSDERALRHGDVMHEHHVSEMMDHAKETFHDRRNDTQAKADARLDWIHDHSD